MRVRSLLSIVLIGSGIAQTTTDSNPVIRSTTREVLLEVVVRDAHGHLVTKIEPGQVSVYEDGVRQDIRSFRLVQGREVRAEDEKQLAQSQTQTTAPASVQRPAFNPLRTVNVVCLVMNDLNADTRAFAFDAARKFVNNELRPDTFIGVFTLDTGGLRPIYPFSNNREHLLKAVELAAINQLPSVPQTSADLLNGLSVATTGAPASTGGANDGTDEVSATNPLGTRGNIGLSVSVGLREIDALTKLVKQLSPLPFEKTVMLMGTGITRPPDQLEYWQALLHSANQGGVTFYALDVYGLSPCQGKPGPDCTSGTTADNSRALLQKSAALSQGQRKAGYSGPKQGSQSGPGPPPGGQAMESMRQSDYLRFGVSSANRQEALRELAVSTGGFIIANTNNTDKLLSRVMEDVDTHYELAYRPASEINDGHFRKIEVKLDRPDLRVQTRSGYFAVPETGEGPLTAADMTGLRALDSKPLPHAFDFRAKAFRFRPEEGSTQYDIAFEIPISSLTSTADAAAKTHRFHVSMLAVVKNARGEIVERVSKDVPSEVSDESLAALRSDDVVYEHAVNLPMGHYKVETAVVDQEGNRASTGVMEIDNRKQPGPGLSDIALVHRVEDLTRPPDSSDPFEIPGKRALPLLSTTLPAGEKALVYFVVYPDKEHNETPSLRADFLKDGRILTTQNSDLPQPDSSGAIPMAIAASAVPGEYEVRVTVQQGKDMVQRSLRYTVVAAAAK